ncbi:MAG: MMPL family transporter, partial [Gammaproteobacteria bacterium]
MSKAAPNPEIGRPRWAYLLHCAVLAVFCIGLLRLEFKINPVQPFDGDAPGVREYAAMKRTFGSDQSLVFQITPEHGAVFTNDSLNVISAVTGRAWSIPYASRVLSIANFPHVSAEGDSISVQSLASAKTPRNPEQRRALGQLATDDPRIRDLLVSHDQSSAAVHVTLQFGEADDNAVATVMAAANRIRDEYASDAYRIAIAGAVPERHRATTNGSSGTRHVGLFVVITTIFMSLVLCFSISLAAATCAALALATFATLGLLGWLEIQLAPGSAAGIALLLVVGYAHLMRVNLRYSRNLGQGAADRAAHDALHAHFGPVSIT